MHTYGSAVPLFAAGRMFLRGRIFCFHTKYNYAWTDLVSTRTYEFFTNEVLPLHAAFLFALSFL